MNKGDALAGLAKDFQSVVCGAAEGGGYGVVVREGRGECFGDYIERAAVDGGVADVSAEVAEADLEIGIVV